MKRPGVGEHEAPRASLAYPTLREKFQAEYREFEEPPKVTAVFFERVGRFVATAKERDHKTCHFDDTGRRFETPMIMCHC
jgi:hypothetical protein